MPVRRSTSRRKRLLSELAQTSLISLVLRKVLLSPALACSFVSWGHSAFVWTSCALCDVCRYHALVKCRTGIKCLFHVDVCNLQPLSDTSLCYLAKRPRSHCCRMYLSALSKWDSGMPKCGGVGQGQHAACRATCSQGASDGVPKPPEVLLAAARSFRCALSRPVLWR